MNFNFLLNYSVFLCCIFPPTHPPFPSLCLHWRNEKASECPVWTAWLNSCVQCSNVNMSQIPIKKQKQLIVINWMVPSLARQMTRPKLFKTETNWSHDYDRKQLHFESGTYHWYQWTVLLPHTCIHSVPWGRNYQSRFTSNQNVVTLFIRLLLFCDHIEEKQPLI